jgi:hypothetical protein
MSIFPSAVFRSGVDADQLVPTYGDEAHLIERAAIMGIKTYLEEECQRQEEIWSQRDQAFAAVMGPSGVMYQAQGIHIERVDPNNFFVGARPSLVNSSIDFWPSVTTRCALVQPAASGEQGDQFDVLNCTLSVEVLCKVGPVRQAELHLQPGIDAEGEVNRQINLLSAAVHMCVRRDPTFGGRALPVQQPPRKSTGLPFAVPGNTAERTGPYWIYMGRQMRYGYQFDSF